MCKCCIKTPEVSSEGVDVLGGRVINRSVCVSGGFDLMCLEG